MQSLSVSSIFQRYRFTAKLLGIVAASAILLPACSDGGGSAPAPNDTQAATSLSFTSAPPEVVAGQTATYRVEHMQVQTNLKLVGATITYAIPFSDQVYATINPSTGVLTANPVQSAAQRTVTVTASALLSTAMQTTLLPPPATSTPVTIRSRITGITLTSGVTATPSALTIRVGDPLAQLVASAAIAAGSPTTPAVQYTFTSSNPAQVAVDLQGRATAVSATPASAPVTITASAEGATSGPVSITVLPALVPVVVVTVPASTTLPLRTGDQVTLLANVANPGTGTGTVTWTSSTPALVSVIPTTGRITAVAPTPAGAPVRITATFTNGPIVATGFIDISVVALSATTISIVRVVGGVPQTLPSTSETLVQGTTATLASVIRDQNNTILVNEPTVWTSSNTAIATVSLTGVVTAVAVGQASIVARPTANVNIQAATAVIVTAPPPTLDVPDNVSVQAGTQTVITATITNPAVGMLLTWVVRPTGGAATLASTSGQTATIQGTAAGATYAVATLTFGSLVLLDSTLVTVTAAPVTGSTIGRIVIEPTNGEITAPATLQYRVRFFNTAGVATTVEAGGSLQFVSCSTGLTVTGTCPLTAQTFATINASTGLATGVAGGTTTVTARYLLYGTLVTSEQTPLIVYPSGTAGHLGSVEISTAANARTVSVSGSPLLFQVIVRDPSGNQITTGTGPTVVPSPDVANANPNLRITRVAGTGFFYQITGLSPTAAGTVANPLANSVVISADVVGARAEIRVVVTP